MIRRGEYVLVSDECFHDLITHPDEHAKCPVKMDDIYVGAKCGCICHEEN